MKARNYKPERLRPDLVGYLFQVLLVFSAHMAVAAEGPESKATSGSADGETVVHGRCIDNDGEPLAGVRVHLYLVDLREEYQRRVQAVTTDPAGSFRFLDVPKLARCDDAAPVL